MVWEGIIMSTAAAFTPEMWIADDADLPCYATMNLEAEVFALNTRFGGILSVAASLRIPDVASPGHA